jgi:hypothetical protein
MGKMAVFLLSAAALTWAQSNAPATVTTGPNTTGTPEVGATTPQGRSGQPAATSPATVPHTTATSETGATTPTDRKQTTGHIPRTATTHSGSTPIAEDQRDVRTMPDTASGWLPVSLLGMLMVTAGLWVRMRSSTTAP